MEELGTPGKRMGHEDGSVQDRYSHVTAGMRQQLLDGLTGVWEAALDARPGTGGRITGRRARSVPAEAGLK
jgi:hypothetical protein